MSGAGVDATVLVALAVVALAGAWVTVRTRDVMRLVLGLGAMLVALAALYLFQGMAYLAAAQVFVYVGGVLVLLLFAIMLLVRDTGGRPEIERRGSLGAAIVSLSLFGVLAASLAPSLPLDVVAAAGGGLDVLGSTLLGRMLPQFEALGVVLLAALVAVLLIVAERRDSR